MPRRAWGRHSSTPFEAFPLFGASGKAASAPAAPPAGGSISNASSRAVQQPYVPPAPPPITSMQGTRACELVWSLAPGQAASSARVFVVAGPPQQPQAYALPEWMNDAFSPQRLSTSAWAELLQAQFASKDGMRRGVQALVLSAAYLPTQLNVLEKLLPMVPLPARAALGISYWVHSQQGGVPHVLVALQQAGDGSGTAASAAAGDDQQLAVLVLACTGQQVVRLAPEAWQAALTAEKQLFMQLRLYDATCWSLSMGALNSKRAQRSTLAVRSLMGPEGIKAVVAMAEKQQLFVAVRMERVRGSKEGDARPDSVQLVECKDVTDAIDHGRQVVLVVSRRKWSADELAAVQAELFTDVVPSL